MIEWLVSKSGTEVPVVDGNVLASRYDPQREAEQFLAKHRESLVSAEVVFLIGAGNALIAQTLLSFHRITNVVIIDPQQDLIQGMAAKFHNDAVSWKYLPINFDSSHFHDLSQFLLCRFKIIVSPAAQFLPFEWQVNCVEFLKGNSIPGFYFQVGLRNPVKRPSPLNVLSQNPQANFGKQKALELMRQPQGGFEKDNTTLILSELVR